MHLCLKILYKFLVRPNIVISNQHETKRLIIYIEVFSAQIVSYQGRVWYLKINIFFDKPIIANTIDKYLVHIHLQILEKQ